MKFGAFERIQLNSVIEKNNRKLHQISIHSLPLEATDLHFVEMVESEMSQSEIAKGSLHQLRVYQSQIHHLKLRGVSACQMSICDSSLSSLFAVETVFDMSLFRDCQIKDCDFRNSRFVNSSLHQVQAEGCDFSYAYWRSVHFSESNLFEACLHADSRFYGCTFNGVSFLNSSDLSFKNFYHCHFVNCVLSESQRETLNFTNHCVQTKPEIRREVEMEAAKKDLPEGERVKTLELPPKVQRGRFGMIEREAAG